MKEHGNLLAIDTSFAACSAAVRMTSSGGREAPTTVVRFEEMSKGHAERLMPMINAVMSEAAIEFGDLSALAVTVGPGSFTGTRVGIAAVRGLALATGLPVYGTTSLAVIACAARADLTKDGTKLSSELIMDVCIDARRDQIYRQTFGDLHQPALTPAEVKSAEEIATGIIHPNPNRLLVGSGAAAVANIMEATTGEIDIGPVKVLPSAEHLLDVHLEHLSPPQPLYLRPADAKPQINKAIAKQSSQQAG